MKDRGRVRQGLRPASIITRTANNGAAFLMPRPQDLESPPSNKCFLRRPPISCFAPLSANLLPTFQHMVKVATVVEQFVCVSFEQ